VLLLLLLLLLLLAHLELRGESLSKRSLR